MDVLAKMVIPGKSVMQTATATGQPEIGNKAIASVFCLVTRAIGSLSKSQIPVRRPFFITRLLPRGRLVPIAYCLLLAANAHAQGNYEIQVYGSDTVDPGTTMIELHSNYTVSGSTAVPGSR